MSEELSPDVEEMPPFVEGGDEAALTSGDWRPLSKTYGSLCHILRDPELSRELFRGQRLEFNEMLQTPTLGGCALLDEDISALRERCESLFKNAKGNALCFGLQDVHQAVRQVAHQSGRFHPVEQYLQALRWDGVRRLDQLPRMLRVGVTPLSRAICRRWMISAVARALQPGCKVDTVLVLVGEQDSWKSTFFKTLAGVDWFIDTGVEIGNKDSYLAVHRAWIFEWPELESLHRTRNMNTVKAFLSSPEDTFRMPYGRSIQSLKRRGVIVGTTNDRDFLTDLTGNRRYWTLDVKTRIDMDQVKRDRDQLWAEAVVAFGDGTGDDQGGERWWLDPDENVELAALQQPFQRRDEGWEPDVFRYVAGKPHVSLRDVLVEGLRKDLATVTRSDQMRVADILKRADWSKAQTTEDGVRATRWYAPQREPGIEG